jgi:hypothetical protein
MLLGGLNMRGNLEELTEALNTELINIKVSEELKLKTLEKCKRSERTFFYKAFTPITCTVVACLLMGVIIYPIYTKNNLINNEQITMNASEKSIEALDKSRIDPPSLSNEANITEGENSKAHSSEIVDQSQKKVNESSKEQKEQNEEKDIIVLNENPTIAFKAKGLVESEKMDKNSSPTNQGSRDTTSNSIIEKETDTKGGSTIALSEIQNNDVLPKEETKMKDLSLQEAREVFGGNIKIPSYIPKGFAMIKILVPEVESSSNKLYEITYSSDFQHFKITEYKNENNSNELGSSSNVQSEEAHENYMVINLNNMAVKYTVSESIDNKEFPYVKLIWENSGRKYSSEGNAPWTELINIISSIIN